jgi:hypothetical protein
MNLKMPAVETLFSRSTPSENEGNPSPFPVRRVQFHDYLAIRTSAFYLELIGSGATLAADFFKRWLFAPSRSVGCREIRRKVQEPHRRRYGESGAGIFVRGVPH